MIISCVATFDAAKTDDTAWFALIRLTYYINPSCHQSDKAGCFGGILPCVCVCVRTIIEKTIDQKLGRYVCMFDRKVFGLLTFDLKSQN